MSLTKLTAEWDYGKYGSGILTLDIPDGSTVWEMGDYFRAILHVLGYHPMLVNGLFSYDKGQYDGQREMSDRQTGQTEQTQED